jgi:hypothetical protein
VFSFYKELCDPQEVWPLRKLCLELTSEMIALIFNMDAFMFILDFLQTSIKPYVVSTSADTPTAIEEENQKKKTENWVRI